MGEKGVYLSQGKKGKVIPAYSVRAVDTTGAGDTFCAGLIHSLLAGAQLEEACRFACAAAAFSTQYKGASTAPLSQDAITRFMQGERIKTTDKNA